MEFDWSNVLATFIGAAISWFAMKAQEKSDMKRREEEKRVKLHYQIREQIILCEEMENIELSKKGALESELAQMQAIWHSLYKFRYESDYSILSSSLDNKLLEDVINGVPYGLNIAKHVNLLMLDQVNTFQLMF